MPAYPIATDRLILRPFQEEDLADVFAYYKQPDVVRYLFVEVQSEAEVRATLAKWQQQTALRAAGERLTLAVALRDTGRVIGETVLIWRSKVDQQGELGFVFNPDYGGKGYATEAARAMLAIGFDEYDLHRIYARCDARNAPSYRLMERLGMRREAHFIHHAKFKGEWDEELYYAMLQEEWRARLSNSGRGREG